MKAILATMFHANPSRPFSRFLIHLISNMIKFLPGQTASDPSHEIPWLRPPKRRNSNVMVAILTKHGNPAPEFGPSIRSGWLGTDFGLYSNYLRIMILTIDPDFLIQ